MFLASAAKFLGCPVSQSSLIVINTQLPHILYHNFRLTSFSMTFVYLSKDLKRLEVTLCFSLSSYVLGFWRILGFLSALSIVYLDCLQHNIRITTFILARASVQWFIPGTEMPPCVLRLISFIIHGVAYCFRVYLHKP